MVPPFHDPQGDLAQNLTALSGALKALDDNPHGQTLGEEDLVIKLRACFSRSPILCCAAAFGTGLLAGAWTARKKTVKAPSFPRLKLPTRTSETWDALKSAALTTGASCILDLLRGSARVAKVCR